MTEAEVWEALVEATDQSIGAGFSCRPASEKVQRRRAVGNANMILRFLENIEEDMSVADLREALRSRYSEISEGLIP